MQWLLAVIAVALLLFSIDDLWFDGLYVLYGRKRSRRVQMRELSSVPHQRIAIIVPAWQEGIVIGQMLAASITLINYPRNRYTLFVGVYPNDPDTQAAVDAVATNHPNVIKVVSDLPGPTTKAANLNGIFRRIQEHETMLNVRFDIVVMHDAEDVIHPTSLKLYNYLIPTYDMVQLPVFPIQPKPTLRNFFQSLTAGTYADEFAEHHTRIMLVRELVGGFVPSAGVGTALKRNALDVLAEENGGVPFDTTALTEDYEMALRLHRRGLRTVYFLEGVERIDAHGQAQVEYIATRETFPNYFGQAVHQKTRWTYGITMQTPQRTQKSGSPWQRYLLYRDIKGKYVNLMTIPVYLTAAWVASSFAVVGHSPFRGPLTQPMNMVMTLNLVIMIERLTLRFHAVSRQYGRKEAVFSTLLLPGFPLRYVWGNLINLAATVRAWRLHLFGTQAAKRTWAKTEHRYFAPPELLEGYRRRLGDLVMEQGYVSGRRLSEALDVQRQTGRKLGELLVEIDGLTPDVVDEALRQQRGGNRQPLGAILVLDGHISQDQLNLALAAQRRSLKPLGAVLIESGLITADDLAAVLDELNHEWLAS